MASTVTLTLSVDDAQTVARMLRVAVEAIGNAAVDGTLYTDWAPSIADNARDMMITAINAGDALTLAAINAVEIEAL